MLVGGIASSLPADWNGSNLAMAFVSRLIRSSRGFPEQPARTRVWNGSNLASSQVGSAILERFQLGYKISNVAHKGPITQVMSFKSATLSWSNNRRGAGRWVGRLMLGILIFGPWPAKNTPLGEIPLRPEIPELADARTERPGRAPFRIGTAGAMFVLGHPVPVAGFVDQITRPYEVTDDACGVRALTIATERATVTIVATDLLLINGDLRALILGQTRLAPEQVYFTATHSHSALGGWGNNPLERLVAGTYDPEVATDLADTIAATILRSRATTQPAEVAFVQVDCPNLQRNRILVGQSTNDRMAAWVFRSVPRADRPPQTLATLAVFGAHATISHPKPPHLGGDYPAAFAEALAKVVDSGMVLFAAGTVGDASPIRPAAPTQRQSVRSYGADLAARLGSQFSALRFDRQLDLANVNLDVALPPIQVPLGSSSWRFSPLATWWIGSRRTNLHILRLGPAYLVGFPGDVAGHLAQRLRSSLPVVATSFNGDYKGYLVPRSTFETTPCYETRAMSFYGPNLGDLLINQAQCKLDDLDRIWSSSRP